MENIHAEELLKEWNIDLIPQDSAERISASGKWIFIYGAGNLGRQVADKLEQAGLRVEGFLDRNARPNQKMLGKPVISPYMTGGVCYSETIKTQAVILIAIMLPSGELSKIRGSLKAEGYQTVITRYSLINPWLLFTDADQKHCREQKKQIVDALELMEDSDSKKIFCSNLKAFSDYSYETALVSGQTVQYFDVQVPFAKGYGDFVDCGAYTGDSLEASFEHVGIKNYYAFEPDRINFEKLSSAVSAHQDKLEKTILFPCGLSNENKCCTFQSGGESASALTEDGDTVVQVVRLSDALKKVPVSMIKMDIEGAEAEALLGAEEIIRTQKPDLCICVYHHVADLWELPLLLHRMVPEYKFYLRAHEKWTIETVLYVTVGE